MKSHKLILLALSGLLIIAGAGAVYAHLAEHYSTLADVGLMPTKPLDNFPMQVGQWQGTPVPISDTVLRVAGVDDHLSRFYVNPDRRRGANLYVGYTAEPRLMLGHRPEVCYIAAGWTHDWTRTEPLQTANGDTIQVNVHRFFRPGLDYQETFVVNYYVLNGRLTPDQSEFTGLGWRRPRQSADGRIAYVAQVQVSSSSEQAAIALTREVADPLMAYMP